MRTRGRKRVRNPENFADVLYEWSLSRGKSAKQRPSRLQSTRSNAFTLASNPPSNCMVDPASGASSSSGFHAVLAGPLCRSAPASLGHGDDYREVDDSLKSCDCLILIF